MWQGNRAHLNDTTPETDYGRKRKKDITTSTYCRLRELWFIKKGRELMRTVKKDMEVKSTPNFKDESGISGNNINTLICH
jgi:hypothetical protein